VVRACRLSRLPGQEFPGGIHLRGRGGTDVGTARDGEGMSIRVLLDRLNERRLGFFEMRFISSSGSELRFRPARSGDASDDALLAELTDPLENNATVVFVAVPLAGGREILCDLRRGRAFRRTAAKFYVTEMLGAALPLLQPVTEEQAHTLGIESPSGAPAVDQAPMEELALSEGDEADTE
jgi:hypothetical protein